LKKKETLEFCKAVAYSSTANLGPGFDVFGLGLDFFYDTVSIHKLATKNGKIKIALDKNVNIPSSAKQNSASLSVMKIAQKFKIRNDLEIRITKGVPIGLGLGSSAASSAAAGPARPTRTGQAPPPPQEPQPQSRRQQPGAA